MDGVDILEGFDDDDDWGTPKKAGSGTNMFTTNADKLNSIQITPRPSFSIAVEEKPPPAKFAVPLSNDTAETAAKPSPTSNVQCPHCKAMNSMPAAPDKGAVAHVCCISCNRKFGVKNIPQAASRDAVRTPIIDDGLSTASADSSLSGHDRADASYRTGVPLKPTGSPEKGQDAFSGPGPSPSTSQKKRPGSGFFGLGKSKAIAVPSEALHSEKAESHMGGIVDENNSCKIYGKAAIWLTPDNLAVKSNGGPTFVWKLGDLKIAKASTTFEHGQFIIDDTSKLGTLLEIQGKITPEEGSKESKETDPLKFHWHVAVRGLGNVGEWVQRIEQQKQALQT